MDPQIFANIGSLKRLIKNTANHPLISGSSIVFVGSILAYFIHYIYNLAMGRLLSPADYGLVTSLVSITLLFLIFQTSLTGIFTRFSAKYIAQKDENALSRLYFSGFKFVVLFAGFIFAFFVLGLPFIQSFLHIEEGYLILLVGIYIFFSILSSLPSGILQGEVRVVVYSLINIFSALLKVTAAVLLVFAGYGAGGALVAICLSMVIPYIVLTIIVKKDIKGKIQKTSHMDFLSREFKGYGLGYFFATLGTTIFISADTILARHFFQADMAGFYAALALMGKSIFYFVFPINFVLFPLTAARYERKENVLNLLLLAVGAVVLACLSAIFIYFVFPGFVLSIFFPAQAYRILVPYLGPFAVYMFVFSLASVLSGFLLSMGKSEVYKINLTCGVLMIVLLFFFHETFYQMIGVMFAISLLLLLLLLIYYLKNGSK